MSSLSAVTADTSSTSSSVSQPPPTIKTPPPPALFIPDSPTVSAPTSLKKVSPDDVSLSFKRIVILVGKGPDDPCFEEAYESTEKTTDAVERFAAAGGGNANGTYKILSRKTDDQAKRLICGIFKPTDEARGCINCPKLEDADRSKYGVNPYQHVPRECIAYYFDPKIVPPTAMLALTSTAFCNPKLKQEDKKIKLGSLQKYVPDCITLDEASLTLEEISKLDPLMVRRIGILDIRGYNPDRHQGNLLYNPKNHTLIPIDQGCIASEGFKDRAEFCWILWPQIDAPITEEEKEWIASFDWETDELVIKQSFSSSNFSPKIAEKVPSFPQKALNTLKYCNYLLKQGTLKGLTLFEIGSFLTGHPWGGESVMQTLYHSVQQQCKSVESTNNSSSSSSHLSEQIDEKLMEKMMKEAIDSCLDHYAQKLKTEIAAHHGSKRDKRKSAIRKQVIDFITPKKPSPKGAGDSSSPNTSAPI